MRLEDIKGVGKVTLQNLEKENILSINDLLYTFPKSYMVYEINNEEAFSGEDVCISGLLEGMPAFIKYKKNVNAIIFYIKINDIRLKCIYFSADYLRYKLYKGVKVELYGKYKNESKEFVVKKLFFEDFTSKVSVDYKLKEVNNSFIQKAIKGVFLSNVDIEETLPLELIDKYQLYDSSKYIYTSHFPMNKEEVRQVLRRRKYEEFFWYAIRLELIKSTRINTIKKKRIPNKDELYTLVNSLDYKLTADQESVIKAIYNDITSDITMNRLIQGDVGCGKSIVSMLGVLMVISSGYQAAVMVPTEILAKQQYEAYKRFFNKLGYKVELLTSSVKKSQKDDILYRLENNRVSIVIGTHALIEDNVLFNRLGIVVIDEQHRFGVNQRQKLIKKYPNVDALYLTATPIPRTLGLTFFGDLDISSIHTMPSGRKPINTKIISYNRINSLMRFINIHLEANEQVYVVCPLVNENEDILATDVYKAYDIFCEYLPDANIKIIHGKMKAYEKDEIMRAFEYGSIDILISTTVIEVGVNVPNATVMVIMDADRFGLAQIHQLRGRVGRSKDQGYCALVTNKIDNDRLKVIESTTDGFIISEEDFKLRGPGDYLGNMQSGYQSLDYADFQADINIWKCACKDAKEMIVKFRMNKVENKVFDSIYKYNEEQKGKIN